MAFRQRSAWAQLTVCRALHAEACRSLRTVQSQAPNCLSACTMLTFAQGTTHLFTEVHCNFTCRPRTGCWHSTSDCLMLAQAGSHLATLALQGHVQAEAQLAVPTKWLLQELQQALPRPQARPTPQTAPLTAQRQTVEGQPCLVVSGEHGHIKQHHDATGGHTFCWFKGCPKALAWLSVLPPQWLRFWCLVQGARMTGTVPACWFARLPGAAIVEHILRNRRELF